ncbi:UDP-N-acetylmuramate dehydrogenase [Aestuariimicrobium ganziense]|uniref:UDP-N-acetylmuramate dehydrogenase n=1 Tax=Aestuariimicrobium ganziense TaxID=2773677 RepID=UPI0019436E1C
MSTSVTAAEPAAASALLADQTTRRLGGAARRLVVAETEADLVSAIREADASSTPVLVLGGGSNLVIGDDGFDGTVVKVATRGVDADVGSCGGAVVTVAAGENWDDFVAFAVAQGWVGVETLSGIPGLVGSTPIQNVGAYGCEVSQTIARVRTLDRRTGQFATFAAADCGFGYRWSRFKAEPGRHVVLQVTFQLPLGDLSAPVRYAELASTLGVEVGQRTPMAAVREAVLAIRGRKGMVLDADDHDTWSAGSFFMNPVLTADQAATLPADAPRYPAPGDMVKTSAAWLIERAGFGRGHARGPVSLSTKHTLALTNRGGATTDDLLALAREVRDGVQQRFGVVLVPEPVMVNCQI